MSVRRPIRMLAWTATAVAAFAGLFAAADRWFVPRPAPASIEEAQAELEELPRSASLLGGTPSPTKPPPDPIRSLGESTAFQRRVWAGDGLRTALEQLQRKEITPYEAKLRYDDLGALQLKYETDFRDWFARMRRSNKRDLMRWVLEDRVVRRGLDTRSLTLRGVQQPRDPLGHNLRVRLWEPTPLEENIAPISDDHLQVADALIARLDRICGTHALRGYDVFAVRRLGHVRVFRGLPFWAAGVFIDDDRLCIVGSQYKPTFRQTVLNHELVHAWHREHRKGWNRRFVTEGLAEYAAWLRPGDEDLRVPVSRVRHNFARLSQMLAKVEEQTGKTVEVNLRDLVYGTPRTFYSLAWLSYPVAEAAYFYVGAEVVERALVSGKQDVLSKALAAISWKDLRAFVGAKAEGGNPKQGGWVHDTPGGLFQSYTEYREAQTAALKGLGIDLQALRRTSLRERLMSRTKLVDRERLARVAAGLLEAAQRGRMAFACDITKAMGEPMQFNTSLDGVGAPHVLDLPATPLRSAFVKAWLDGLGNIGALTTSRTLGIGKTVVPKRLPAITRRPALHLAGLTSWLKGVHEGIAAERAHQGLVVCVASSDRAGRAEHGVEAVLGVASQGHEFRERRLAVELAPALVPTRHPPAWVLVVDLASGNSEALALAQALTAAWRRSEVALWDPAARE